MQSSLCSKTCYGLFLSSWRNVAHQTNEYVFIGCSSLSKWHILWRVVTSMDLLWMYGSCDGLGMVIGTNNVVTGLRYFGKWGDVSGTCTGRLSLDMQGDAASEKWHWSHWEYSVYSFQDMGSAKRKKKALSVPSFARNQTSFDFVKLFKPSIAHIQIITFNEKPM